MRKRGMLLLTLLLAFGLLSGCGTEEETSSAGAGETRTAEETPAPEKAEIGFYKKSEDPGVEAARSVMTSVVSSGASTEATPAPLSSEPKTKDA